VLAVGAALAALAAGVWTGMPRPARADEPSSAQVTPPPVAAATALVAAAPVVLDAPVYFAPGQLLDVRLGARTAARRDAVRITATFRTPEGTVVGVRHFSARITGGGWRTLRFTLDVPDGAVSVELVGTAVVGPIEVDVPVVESIRSSAAQPPGDE
jgi:hypothetical protein